MTDEKADRVIEFLFRLCRLFPKSTHSELVTWFKTPNKAFRNRIPLDLVISDNDQDMSILEEMLHDIEDGNPY